MRVLIGASSEVVRAGLESLLATAPTFQVVGSFPITAALARFEDLQPEIVLLDLESPFDESLSAAIQSAGVLSSPGLVILTEDPENLAVDVLGSALRAIPIAGVRSLPRPGRFCFTRAGESGQRSWSARNDATLEPRRQMR